MVKTLCNNILFIVLLLLSACFSRPDGIFIQRTYYTGGHVKSEVAYIHDTIKEGPADYYFDQKDNYSLQLEVYYKNGVLDSIFKSYYPDGLVKETGFHCYGLPMGPFYFYYPDGRLKCYNAVDYYDKVFYSVFYDSVTGKVNYQKGLAVSPRVGVLPAAAGTVHLVFACALPPHCRSSAEIGVYIAGSNNVLFLPFAPCKAGQQIVEYNHTFAGSGSYEVVCRAAIYDSVTGLTAIDSAAYAITTK